MSSKNVTSQTETSKKTFHRRKAGRTLVVLPKDGFKNEMLGNLSGMVSDNEVKSGTHFLTFSTSTDALSALKELKKNYYKNMKVSFSHYKLFFKIEGLDKDSDYGVVKKSHMEAVEKATDAKVLYYKLYRKNDEFVGCGDMTVDTKEAMDKLLTSEESKEISFGSFKTTNYVYKKKDMMKEDEE